MKMIKAERVNEGEERGIKVSLDGLSKDLIVEFGMILMTFLKSNKFTAIEIEATIYSAFGTTHKEYILKDLLKHLKEGV